MVAGNCRSGCLPLFGCGPIVARHFLPEPILLIPPAGNPLSFEGEFHDYLDQ